MLDYYKFKIDQGMITLNQVPEPYRTMLRNMGYTDPSDPPAEPTENGEPDAE